MNIGDRSRTTFNPSRLIDVMNYILPKPHAIHLQLKTLINFSI